MRTVIVVVVVVVWCICLTGCDKTANPPSIVGIWTETSDSSVTIANNIITSDTIYHRVGYIDTFRVDHTCEIGTPQSGSTTCIFTESGTSLVLYTNSGYNVFMRANINTLTDHTLILQVSDTSYSPPVLVIHNNTFTYSR